MKRFRINSLKKQTEKSLLERDISQRNTPLKTLGFLVDEILFNDFEKLSEFGMELGLQAKDIKVFTFVKSHRRSPSLRQNQITNKEFGWNGEIHNDNAKEFLEYQFDVLVGYYNGHHKFLDALVAQSKAHFKIGFNGADARLYDLLLTADLQIPTELKSEVKKYLKILNKI